MALRGYTGFSASAVATSISVSVASIGIQQGDVVLLFIEGGGTGSGAFTWPFGFNAISGLSNVTFYGAAGSSSGAVAYKIATASEPSSYSIGYSVSDFLSVQCRVYSGRNAADPFSAVATTPYVVATGTSPVPLTLTGLTAVAGDDIVVLLGFCNTPSSTSESVTVAAASGFGNAATYISSGTAYSPAIGAFDRVGAPAGATGTINSSFTYVSYIPYSYAGYTVSLAAEPVALMGQICL